MSLKNLNETIKIPKQYKKKLTNLRIKKIYINFEKNLKIKENFAVAVSGGPDSLALAFLSKIYSLNNKLVSKFLIVDHRLRPESTKEAKLVKKKYNKLFIVTPGIRLPGDRSDDQARVVTPYEALKINKVNAIVMGRSLIRGNIKNNIKKLIDHLNK